MDLAASATFVAEPQEKGAMKKPPTNPTERFMNKPCFRPLFLGALSLFLAVTATYLFTYYTTTTKRIRLRTYSCVCNMDVWAHLFSVNFRSENEPLLKQGIFQTRLCCFGRSWWLSCWLSGDCRRCRFRYRLQLYGYSIGFWRCGLRLWRRSGWNSKSFFNRKNLGAKS